MTPFEGIAALIGLAAALSYVNLRFFHAPRPVALIVGGLGGAAITALADHFAIGNPLGAALSATISRFDFSSFVLHRVLGFVIFAGALNVDVRALRHRAAAVGLLASAGVVLSTALVAGGTFAIARLAGLDLPLVTCFLFGAIISPTDPVAVLGIMRQLSVRRQLEVETAGESLFNDGVSIVVFLIIVSTAGGTTAGSVAGRAAILFAREALGGCLIGLVLGWIVYVLLKGIDDPNVEVFLSFALVVVTSAVAESLGASAPLACAVAGLLIGDVARRNAMKQDTRAALETLWSFADYLLNTMLFLIVGLEAFAVSWESHRMVAIFAAIPLVVVARFASVAAASLLVRHSSFEIRSVVALTWSGIRGAVSIALALASPAVAGRNFLVEATFAVVLFSTIVQGLTVQPLLNKLSLQSESEVTG